MALCSLMATSTHQDLYRAAEIGKALLSGGELTTNTVIGCGSEGDPEGDPVDGHRACLPGLTSTIRLDRQPPSPERLQSVDPGEKV